VRRGSPSWHVRGEKWVIPATAVPALPLRRPGPPL
jgi:hypothetical protein